MTPRSSTETIIQALRILSQEIQSGDGVANACLAEAADRLQEGFDIVEHLTGDAAYSGCSHGLKIACDKFLGIDDNRPE